MKRCSLCKRKINGIRYSWHNFALGISDLIRICSECDMSMQEQYFIIWEEKRQNIIKKIDDYKSKWKP